MPPRWGFCDFEVPFPGLSPWALRCRTFGAKTWRYSRDVRWVTAGARLIAMPTILSAPILILMAVVSDHDCLAECLAAQKPNPMFPDGLVHDFGKVQRGTIVNHAFRIVNTLNVPLRIVSLRLS